MSSAHLSPEIRRFIAARIPSVPFLEALLLLRSRPGSWQAGELARRLYLGETAAAELMQQLESAQLAQRTDTSVAYAPDDAMGGIVDELADVYSRRVVEVTELIHASTSSRAEAFANAFVFRRSE